MGEKTEIIVKNVAYNVGEGPHWDERNDSLVYVDIMLGRVHRWNSITKENQTNEFDGPVGFVFPGQGDDDYVIGHKRSIVHFDWGPKNTKTIASVEEDKEEHRFNDAKCDSRGRIVGGTMNTDVRNMEIRKQFVGGVYSMDTDGSFGQRKDRASIPNGIAWTRDDKTMFFIDSTPRTLYAFDYDITTGDMSNKRTVFDFGQDESKAAGAPDGMTIDADDKLWVAFYNLGKVIRLDPETKQELRVVNIPGARQTTSCCFGGKDYEDLYVTTGRQFLTDDDVAQEQPSAGSIFRVTGLGVKGRPNHSYRGPCS